MPAPAAFLHPENALKSLAAGASPQTPLGELTDRSPDPTYIAGLRGPTSKGRRQKGREERGGERRGGEGLWTLTMLESD